MGMNTEKSVRPSGAITSLRSQRYSSMPSFTTKPRSGSAAAYTASANFAASSSLYGGASVHSTRVLNSSICIMAAFQTSRSAGNVSAKRVFR